MSDKAVLTVSEREVRGKANRKLRADGQVPAVVYGHGVDSQAISAPAGEIEKVFAQAGTNQIIGLKVGDARQKNVIFHQVQLSPRTGNITHADLYVVKMNEKLRTEVPLHLVGESTAVYKDEGTLVKNLETLDIEALPADLPEQIEVDISVITSFDQTITVADLPIPDGVAVVTPAEELVVKVEPPRSDEEMEELEAPIVDGEAEVEGAEPTDGEEASDEEKPAEGDKPAAE